MGGSDSEEEEDGEEEKVGFLGDGWLLKVFGFATILTVAGVSAAWQTTQVESDCARSPAPPPTSPLPTPNSVPYLTFFPTARPTATGLASNYVDAITTAYPTSHPTSADYCLRLRMASSLWESCREVEHHGEALQAMYHMQNQDQASCLSHHPWNHDKLGFKEQHAHRLRTAKAFGFLTSILSALACLHLLLGHRASRTAAVLFCATMFSTSTLSYAVVVCAGQDEDDRAEGRCVFRFTSDSCRNSSGWKLDYEAADSLERCTMQSTPGPAIFCTIIASLMFVYAGYYVMFENDGDNPQTSSGATVAPAPAATSTAATAATAAIEAQVGASISEGRRKDVVEEVDAISGGSRKESDDKELRVIDIDSEDEDEVRKAEKKRLKKERKRRKKEKKEKKERKRQEKKERKQRKKEEEEAAAAAAAAAAAPAVAAEDAKSRPLFAGALGPGTEADDQEKVNEVRESQGGEKRDGNDGGGAGMVRMGMGSISGPSTNSLER